MTSTSDDKKNIAWRLREAAAGHLGKHQVNADARLCCHTVTVEFTESSEWHRSADG